ncbi:MAG: Nif3-like dinuclear metal center hexameric protein, partial [Opitutales bacterium]|nr:Nif3-like dinuclear metal center hexameric protein [Opitutales bacterium]
YKLLIENNIAVYSSHLPLDGHPEIGNNVSIAKILNLETEKFALIDQKLEFKSPVCSTKLSTKALEAELNTIFPDTKSIMFGPVHPKQILICSGAVGHLIYELPKQNIDTLITGEIQQHMFGFAYEHSLNIFACGHYATEIFGVQNLSKIVANKFHLPSTFLPEDCRF